MTRDPSIPRLALTVPLSLLLHGGVALYLVARSAPGDSARLSPDAVLAPPQKPTEVQLGLDKDLPASVDWVGYDEYRRHIARLAETDQAAMTDKPPAGSEAAAVADVPTQVAAPVEEPAEAPVEAPAASSIESEEADLPDTEPVTPTAESTESAGPQAMPKNAAETERPDVPTVTLPDVTRITRLLGPVIDRVEAMLRTAPARDAAEGSRSAKAAESSSPSAPPSEKAMPASAPSREGRPVQPHEETGDVTDRQSDATSRLDVTRDQWQLGKPLSGRGVELKPRRAEVPLFTRFTAALRSNPICRMEFDRTGKVVRAMILVPSGDPRVDEDILNSLYGWRASGSAIDALQANGVFAVELRYVLMSGR